MIEYHAAISVDTSFFCKLDGVYNVENYTLRPCKITEKNQIIGCSNFSLEFNFHGLDEKGVDKSIKVENHFANMEKAIQVAKPFVAWLVLSIKEWARLSSQSHGHTMKFGPFVHQPANLFNESVLETALHIDKNAKDGKFFQVQRPVFSFSGSARDGGTLKLPSDFPELTRKLFALRRRERDRFLNACFSYQFGLENWTAYPTISLLSFVSAVESMMADEYVSGFCSEASKQCSLKRSMTKKFRLFFERNLQFPLPAELKGFLDRVYSKRSKYVHKALLGEDERRGIRFGFEGRKQLFDTERSNLEKLVNAALIEWLRRV